MLSTGTLNGSPLNVELVNGGHFIIAAASTVAASAMCQADAVRRVTVGANIMAVSGAGLAPHRRQRWAASASGLGIVTATAARRAVGGAAIVAGTTVAAGGRRRLVAGAMIGGRSDVSARLGWRFIHYAPTRRTFRLALDRRELRLATSPRRLAMVARRAVFVVPRNERERP